MTRLYNKMCYKYVPYTVTLLTKSASQAVSCFSDNSSSVISNMIFNPRPGNNVGCDNFRNMSSGDCHDMSSALGHV